MSIKTPFFALALAAAVALPTLAPTTVEARDSTPRIDTRQANQLERISKNLMRGHINIAEAIELLEGQQRVNRMERSALRDGHISRKERRQIEKVQDRQSRRIAKVTRDHSRDRYAWSDPDHYDWRDR